MNKLITKKRFLIFSLYVLLAIIVFCSFDIYFFGYKSNLSKFTTKIFPYPALIVNNEIVTINKYEKFLKDYRLYLLESNKVKDDSNNQGLKAMIQNIALKQVVSKLDIDIDQREFNRYIDGFYNNNDNIKITKDRFNDYFLKPLFYRQKILEKITDDDFNLENKKKAERIYNDLVNDPDAFTSYSDEYKDKSLGINGNLLGWLSYGSLPESLKMKVTKMDIGDFTAVIKSISGYHIYKLNGKIKNEEDDSYYYEFDQVFLPIENFNNYLENFLQKSKVFYLLK
jgi:parvulin-like peptidyl-prolyl isomerase